MSEQYPISRFPIPDVSTLPDDLRTRIETLQEKMGFIPNVFLGHAHRPNQLRAFLAMHDDLMESDDPVTTDELSAMPTNLHGRPQWGSHSCRRGGAKHARETMHKTEATEDDINRHFGWMIEYLKDKARQVAYAATLPALSRIRATLGF